MRMRYDSTAERMPARVVDGFALLAGLYLAISPWVLGFQSTSALAVNNLIIGAAMVLLALGFASAFGRTHGMTWVAPLLGAWAIVAPWVIQGGVHTTTNVISNSIAGGVFLLAGLAAAAAGMRRARAQS